MKKLLLVLVGIGLFNYLASGEVRSTVADEVKYPVSVITEPLKKDADVVVRKYSLSFEWKSTAEIIEKAYVAITVLNKEGKVIPYLPEEYDKHKKIKSIKGNIYDAQGQLVRKLGHADILDMSVVEERPPYDGIRRKIINPGKLKYPYTLEYEFEIIHKGMVTSSLWAPQLMRKMSIEISDFTITVPSEMEFVYKGVNVGDPEEEEDGAKKMVWKVQDLKAIPNVSFSAPLYESTPIVYGAPKSFEFDGTVGDATSWSSIGKWHYDLIKDQGILGDEHSGTLRALTAGVKENREKVKAVYKYIQDKIDHIEVLPSSGGWRPESASSVAQNKYGDGKALVNFTKSVLEAINIPSYYALINTNIDLIRIDESFPSHVFDYTILCVPLSGDTLWLDCAHPIHPFGHLGLYTSDRKALIVTPDGGVLSTTSKNSASENTYSRKALLFLNEDGNGTGRVSTKYTGFKYDMVSPNLKLDDIQKREALYRRIHIPSYEIGRASYTLDDAKEPCIKESLMMLIQNIGKVEGNKIIIEPNIMDKHAYPSEKKRSEDIVITHGFEEYDTISYQLPEGYKVSSLPQPQKFTTTYATYSASAKTDNGKLIYIRSLKFNEGRVLENKLEEMLAFMKKVADADRLKVVLSK